MSYDITLNDPVTKETIELDAPHQIKGGTYAINGTSEAWLNVTYNYARWYYKDGVFPSKDGESQGIRTIYGMSGAETQTNQRDRPRMETRTQILCILRL